MTLTELATRLNSRHPGGGKLPPILLLTDGVRLPDPLPAAATLPRGAGVILRHYDDPDRPALARELASLCRHRGLRLLIAGDGPLAAQAEAAGIPGADLETLFAHLVSASGDDHGIGR